MKYPESFSDYPKSITEIKADTSEDGALWTVRDSVISFLRRIDSGEINPDAVVIIAREVNDEGTRTVFSQKGPDTHTILGLIEAFKLCFWHG